MEIWMLLWKAVFIVTVVLFAGMTVWVIVGGWIDIQALFRHLKEQKPEDDSHEGE